ncbi:MAG: presqualene diphosphate synthase HpnD [Gammaproteobacteria bacterium]|nr:presqualene diphosphate synthase HpnD [Gammaproteobacteria bacterium]MCY4165720.1 presqualene diphosphate synthase HpnD [Gammaproteobacteria bacterium]MCY4255505.1 presqualene diphosphate synthase HpnD [Gammaproteobacteria bacterium]MCY4341734.1 presqualene diphosphate synthase HpnD [Gammaproteobacteria bacterium]
MSLNHSSTPVALRPVEQGEAAKAHVHQLVRNSKSSFYWGMRLLPEQRRQAMYAIYSFCRAVDDIADDPGKTGDKLRALDEWRERIRHLYCGQPQCLVTQALAEPVERFRLPQEEFHLVIDGVAIDAAQTVRMQDLEALLDYCRKVAGAVGMLSIRAFGMPRRAGPEIAVALGHAMQLTNILRDINEDAGRQRLYVPEELLQRHRVGGKGIGNIIAHPRFPAACADLAGRAIGYYSKTDKLLPQLSQRVTRPVVIMMEIYRHTLKKLDARGWQQWAEPVAIGRCRKLWMVLRHGFLHSRTSG